MILSFQKQFVPLIQDGTKIHTLRRDVHKRWKPGMKIHFYEGNPRNGGKQFMDGVCTSVQRVDYVLTHGESPLWLIDKREVDVMLFSKNDGFASPISLMTWFNSNVDPIEDWSLIHWTDFKY